MAGLTNPIPLVTALVSLLPAGVLFFVAYGRYDGLFRDNVVFLHFIGGLILGALLSLFAVWSAVFGVLYFITLVPLLYAIAPVAVLNRRKWQGDRHSVFNGGAMGLGIAAMTSFAFVFRDLQAGMNAIAIATWALIALGFAGIGLAYGLTLGAGVAEKRPIRGALVATPLNVLIFVILEEYLRSRALLWVGVAAIVGVTAYFLAYSRVMPKGVEPGSRRARRRRSEAE